MAYQIEYGKGPRCSYSNRRNGWPRILLVIGLVIAGAMAGFYAVQSVGLENLLPGDPAVTGIALDTMVENLRSGLAAGEAFATFCEEIVTHAQFFE